MNSIDTVIFQIWLQCLTLYKSPVHQQNYEVTLILLDLGRKAPETKMQKHLLCILCQALKKRGGVKINCKYFYTSLKLFSRFCHFSQDFAKWGYFTLAAPLLLLLKWVSLFSLDGPKLLGELHIWAAGLCRCSTDGDDASTWTNC